MNNFVNNIFTDTSPSNYDEYYANDSLKHLYFKDYKYLKNVSWDDDNKINWFEVLTLLSAFASITLVLFLEL